MFRPKSWQLGEQSELPKDLYKQLDPIAEITQSAKVILIKSENLKILAPLKSSEPA